MVTVQLKNENLQEYLFKQTLLRNNPSKCKDLNMVNIPIPF